MESQDKAMWREREWEKGNRRAKAITERLACVSFDGFDPAYPPKSRVSRLGVFDCHLNQSRGGFENGPPTRGATE